MKALVKVDLEVRTRTTKNFPWQEDDVCGQYVMYLCLDTLYCVRCLTLGCFRARQAASPETAEVGRIDLGDWLGGEAIFIPNSGGAEEDDGFLVTFVSPKDCGSSGKQGDRNILKTSHV